MGSIGSSDNERDDRVTDAVGRRRDLRARHPLLDLLTAPRVRDRTVSAQLSRADKIEDAKRVPTKTGEERTVNIDSGLVTLFRDLKERAFAEGRARPQDFIFRTRNGFPVSYRKVWEVFNSAANKANLNEAGRRLRFHDLRRTYASILINDGEPITHVAAQLGHTPAILLSTYSGLIKAQEGQHRERQLGAVAAFREGGAL